MSKSRIKTATAEVESKEELGIVCGEIAELQNDLNALTAEYNKKLDDLNAEYVPKITKLKTAIAARMKPALSWCVSNEDTVFKDVKTIDFVRADAQFRSGKPEVQLRSGWNTEKVIKALKSFVKQVPNGDKLEDLFGKIFVRQKEEIAKDEILANRKKLTKEEWFGLGIKIAQGHSLIVTPKGEKMESKQTLQESQVAA